MRNQHNDVGDELKAVAQDMLALGARAMRAGRDWLSDWRNDMSDRNRGHQSGQGGPGPRAYQAERNAPWQGQPHGRGDQPHTHRPDYYASQDYGRGQAYGEDGLHAEYGSYGGSYREYGQTGDNRSGERGQQGRERTSWLDQQGGQARGQSQWSRGGYGAGSGSYPQDYSPRDTGRRPGTGYGTSSSYGDPEQYSYAGDYDEPGFVSPADTQFRSGHSSRRHGSGRYSGMGPRNYTRPDARINEDLCERLTHDPDIDASDIEVRVSDGEVTLQGTVEHRWMKHRAEDLADSCSGVRHVENNIRVRSQHGGSPSQGGTGSSRHTGASGGSQTGSPSTPTSRAAGSQGGSSGAGSHVSTGTGGGAAAGGGPGSSPGQATTGSSGQGGTTQGGSGSPQGGSTPGNPNR